ncbi:membrane-anchored mycosin MYCP [Rhodococcus sp. SMB37]|uniref:type VII secretion-associated serine protease mycosin n=1 Tax=Rhodococcus sp. SMB37 TaxID=2512213 RepID=UPI0010E71D7E|nr:type VII secretion-associated serine protease mycosin [Rhodococcus sp. SMB37]TCN57293.1 membrane-anchored mycosin MYCP [Rhodococcus sp. SMB37]
MTRRRRLTPACLVATLIVAISTGAAVGPATAAPPVPDSGLLPAGDEPAAPEPAEQRNLCTRGRTVADDPQRPLAQRIMDFERVWPLTRGAGQVVAVIDTGVNRHPRLPRVTPGGDYVATDDGTVDCDAHGTLVAGLIAAQPVEGSGFAGGAPDVEVIAIRQSSRNYSDRSAGDEEAAQNSPGYGDVRTLASAVRHAADLGATVINISEVACTLASDGIADGPLGAAVQYATDVEDAVVVAAAGNKDVCPAWNPPAANPLDPHADPWDSITTIASPAWYDDYVLTVGWVEADGTPSDESVPGPWVDVAAPGSGIVSLDPFSDGLIDAQISTQGPVLLSGTSFSAPLVSATVALVRARHPHLDARAVMDRIESTAHAPAEGWNPRVGHGIVDPLAAVTAPLLTERDDPATPKQIAGPTPVDPPDPTPRYVAWGAGAAVLGMLVFALMAALPFRERARRRELGRDRHSPVPSGAGRGSGATPS